MNNTPSLRIAIFASVSSPQQATVDKDSLPSQLRDGRLWADSVAGDVVATFEVPGHSRKYIFFQDAEREIPAYARLREACEQGSFDVLWCRARDRLGRTDALIAQVEALVTNAGAEVYSATMPTTIGETSEASALFLAAIERAQAQVENVIKAKRQRVGMSARVRSGLPSGHWTYGYQPVRNEQGKVVGGEFNKEEIEAVRLITHLFLEGKSYNDILDALNESPWKPRKSNRWRFSTVWTMLHNDVYAGYVTFGDARNDKPSDKFPILWDPETHQAIIAERRRHHPGRKFRSSRVSGIPICARCGRTMTLHRDRKEVVRFRCPKHASKRRSEPCHVNWVKEDALVEILHAALEKYHDDPLLVDQILADSAPERAPLEEELNRLRKLIESTQAKRKRLALTLADGKMTADVYRAADDDLVDQLDHAVSCAVEMQEQLGSLPALEELRAEIEELAADPDWLLNGPLDEVRDKLGRAGIRVMVEECQIREIVVSAS